MEASDGYSLLYLAVFLAVLIIIGIALIAVFAPEYTGLALIIVCVLAVIVIAFAVGLGDVRHEG